MNKSDVEMDMVILAYTNCQTINLPNGYTEMLNQRISQAKGKEHLDFYLKKRIAVIALFLICVFGVGVSFSSEHLFKGRGHSSHYTGKKDVKDIQTSEAEAEGVKTPKKQENSVDFDAEDVAIQMTMNLFQKQREDLQVVNKNDQVLDGETQPTQSYVSICSQSDQIQYTIQVDLKAQQVVGIDLEGDITNYATDISEDQELEQSLYAQAQTQNDIFTKKQYSGSRCYIQTTIDKDLGILQHGTVNYCFETTQDMISIISYSYTTNTFFQYRLLTKEAFEGWKNRMMQQCEDSKWEFVYREIN